MKCFIVSAFSLLLLPFMNVSGQITCELYTFSKTKLETVKQSYVPSGNEPDASVKKLLHEADKALKDSVYSVVFKPQVPPDGDKHNYMSMARYFWPDSNKADGAYIRKDGQSNPEIKEYPDSRSLNKMCHAVQNLSLAFYITGKKAYAEKASRLLQAWFLDTATRMNPNMNYAQAVKGLNEGKASGVLETREFIHLLDMVDLLHSQKGMDEAIYTGLQAWFKEYLTWLDTSKNGKGEQRAANNHGTWCAAQYARYAVFIGRKDLALEKLEGLKARVAAQIEPDGRQPLELARTKSLSYSCFNLKAYCEAAMEAEKLGLDLWTYKTDDGRSIKKALDYILPYAMHPETYKGQQIVRFDKNEAALLLRVAAVRYAEDKQYQLWLTDFEESTGEDIDKLVY
jgi:hypothetical protein